MRISAASVVSTPPNTEETKRDRQSLLAMTGYGHGVTVQRCGCCTSRAGDIDQYRRDTCAQARSCVQRDHENHTGGGIHLQSQRQQDNDRIGCAKSRYCPDNDTEYGGGENNPPISQCLREQINKNAGIKTHG